jgi:hypothetical protein
MEEQHLMPLWSLPRGQSITQQSQEQSPGRWMMENQIQIIKARNNNNQYCIF